MMVWPQVLDMVRLYPAFEAISEHCHKTPCCECPVYAVCENMVFMSGNDMEDIALSFLESIKDDFSEYCEVEEEAG